MHFLTFLPHHFVIFTVLLLSENLCVEQFWVNMVVELMYLHIWLSDLACPHVFLNIYCAQVPLAWSGYSLVNENLYIAELCVADTQHTE